MGNIELKIDGEVIVLTSQQTEQLKRAVIKETSVPAPKLFGSLSISCKPGGKSDSYPFVISSVCKTGSAWGCKANSYGWDMSLTDVKTFIREIKAYAAKIWPTAPQVLGNV